MDIFYHLILIENIMDTDFFMQVLLLKKLPKQMQPSKLLKTLSPKHLLLLRLKTILLPLWFVKNSSPIPTTHLLAPSLINRAKLSPMPRLVLPRSLLAIHLTPKQNHQKIVPPLRIMKRMLLRKRKKKKKRALLHQKRVKPHEKRALLHQKRAKPHPLQTHSSPPPNC